MGQPAAKLVAEAGARKQYSEMPNQSEQTKKADKVNVRVTDLVALFRKVEAGYKDLGSNRPDHSGRAKRPQFGPMIK